MGGRPQASRRFHGSLKGDLIDNLSSKEREIKEACFLVSYPTEKIEAFVKQETMLWLL